MRERILIAGAVLVGAALVAGAAMLLVARDQPKKQPAPALAALPGELFRPRRRSPVLSSASSTAQAMTLG